MYTYKERKRHLTELRDPEAADIDLRLLVRRSPRVRPAYLRHPRRYADEILYELLAVATREEIRRNRREERVAASGDAPSGASGEVPSEVSGDAPSDASGDASSEVSGDAPSGEASGDASSGASGEVPSEVSGDAPSGEASGDALSEVSGDAPSGEASGDASSGASDEVPSEASGDAPESEKKKAPATGKAAPSKSRRNTPA